MLLHHPHRTVAKLRRKLVPRSTHHGSFSQIGASGKPGTLHYVAYLKEHGIGAFASHKDKPHIDDVMRDHTIGHRPVDSTVGQKWDNAWRVHRSDKEFW
jgi:hypothetical protein